MIITGHHARIISLGEVKAQNGFSKCVARIETRERKDETGDVIYSPQTFDVEVPLKKDATDYPELKTLADSQSYFPALFKLRSFIYHEGNPPREKLGKQLQLKKWTR